MTNHADSPSTGAQRITIVVACDDHYMIMLAALLKSIEKHYGGKEPMDVYIVEDKVTAASKRQLQQSINKWVLHLHWIPMETAIPADMRLPVVNNSYPLNTFIRLFIPHFLPQHLARALFMDVDMIVLDDIQKLWAHDIGDCVIGAVQDSITKTIGNLDGGGIPNYEALGLPADAKYFNAGLQLINLPKWREEKTTEAIIDCVNDNLKDANMGDQYGLNVVLVNRWHELPALWNYMANGDHAHPHLIHFIHRKPFYKSYFNNAAYQKIFYDYLAETAWKSARPVGESRRYVKKLNNVLEKVKARFSKA